MSEWEEGSEEEREKGNSEEEMSDNFLLIFRTLLSLLFLSYSKSQASFHSPSFLPRYFYSSKFNIISLFQVSGHHLSFLSQSSSALIPSSSPSPFERLIKEKSKRQKMSLYYTMRNSFHSVNFNQLCSFSLYIFTFNPHED